MARGGMHGEGGGMRGMHAPLLRDTAGAVSLVKATINYSYLEFD